MSIYRVSLQVDVNVKLQSLIDSGPGEGEFERAAALGFRAMARVLAHLPAQIMDIRIEVWPAHDPDAIEWFRIEDLPCLPFSSEEGSVKK